jgi:hypothetical protein
MISGRSQTSWVKQTKFQESEFMNFNLRKSMLGIVAGLLVAFAGLSPQADASEQYTATHRSNEMTDLVTAIGGTGFLMILTGAQPASVATVRIIRKPSL